MKKITEAIIQKDASINKIQFDKEWFYSVKDMADYLGENLDGVEYINLPMIIDEVTFTVKSATLEDILRFLKKEPLEEFRGSVLRNKKLLVAKSAPKSKRKK